MNQAAKKKYRHMDGIGPYDIPLEDYDMSQREPFQNNTFWSFFDRMRQEDPIHYCKDSKFGPFWSVTKFKDIVEVEKLGQWLAASLEKGSGGVDR